MNDLLQHKYKLLVDEIKKHQSAVVAFSGGVDSTLLARVCKDVLGSDAVLLVTATSSTYPESEKNEAINLAKLIGLPHQIIQSEELDLPEFRDNPPNRCYYCKSALFGKIKEIATHKKMTIIFDGNNVSDLGDFRPGRTAACEFGVVSPLIIAKMTKQDVRDLSFELALPTASKPAFACLASRFPYGETITKEKLGRVEHVEEALKTLGFSQFRVRSHEDLARIECVENEIDKAFALRKQLDTICKKAGYIFCSLDLIGYRTGAMNEALPKN